MLNLSIVQQYHFSLLTSCETCLLFSYLRATKHNQPWHLNREKRINQPLCVPVSSMVEAFRPNLRCHHYCFRQQRISTVHVKFNPAEATTITRSTVYIDFFFCFDHSANINHIPSKTIVNMQILSDSTQWLNHAESDNNHTIDCFLLLCLFPRVFSIDAHPPTPQRTLRQTSWPPLPWCLRNLYDMKPQLFEYQRSLRALRS